jgi:D-alanyl-D-alanine carboxypeptidase/D-alanyl-D-alanine-endopeptidase (penicillin-binding protein 4)
LRDNHTLPDLLPVAGRTGTLATRMVGTVAEGVVRAKSGSLHNACCLSGYVMDGDQPIAVFSILCAASPEQAESAVDEIAAAFAAAATR